MHIPDNILSGPVLGATGVVAAGTVAYGLRRIDYAEIPKVGVLASVFFLASLVHVPVGIGSVHLVLNGLMGLLLSWAAVPAIAAALLLQAFFFQHGGITALGANTVIMALPAVITHALLARRIARSPLAKSTFLAFFAGAFSILLSSVLLAASLCASGREFTAAALALMAGNFPVMLIDGFVTLAAVRFLLQVRPEYLRSPPLEE